MDRYRWSYGAQLDSLNAGLASLESSMHWRIMDRLLSVMDVLSSDADRPSGSPWRAGCLGSIIFGAVLSSCDGSTVPSNLTVHLKRMEGRAQGLWDVFGLLNIELEDPVFIVTCVTCSLGVMLSSGRSSLPFEFQSGILLVVTYCEFMTITRKNELLVLARRRRNYLRSIFVVFVS